MKKTIQWLRMPLFQLCTVMVLITVGGLSQATEPTTQGDKLVDEAKKETEKLQGKWKIVKFETPPDKQRSAEVLANLHLIFADGKLTTCIDDRLVEETSFKLDPTKNPKWFDTVSTTGSNKGKIAEGIYELDGDNLKICIGPPGQKRPTEFKVSAEENKQTGLMILKRVKP
jgi:uncharacterized protein (TIGR03067 family)